MSKLFESGMNRRSALKLMAVTSVSALAMGAGLVGCGQQGGGSPSGAVTGAKYYQVDKFASMSGADQLKELTAQGFGYFDTQSDYYWAGVPNENPFTGTVWVNFHSVDVDEEGYDVMSRDDVSSDMPINYLEMRWDNVESPADSPEGTLQKFAEACGFGEVSVQGWTKNQYSYVGFGTCTIEGEDGYWVVEITSNYDTNEEGEYARVDNAYVRVFVGRLNGMSMEDIKASYLPSEGENGTADETSSGTTSASANEEQSAVENADAESTATESTTN